MVQPLDNRPLRATPLHHRHAAAGARLVPFAGWEMPVHYRGIREEHLAVRSAAGIFDVSHMGQIEVVGPDALAVLQRLLSNDVSAVPIGGAQYSVLCAPDGGVLDDLFTYRLGEDHYLTVTNASNHDADLAWFRAQRCSDAVEILDRIDDYAMLAVQGPAARSYVSAIADGGLPPRMRVARLNLLGVPAVVCGTGYTGEDGVEILCSPTDAPRIWDGLRDLGVPPVGLGARDTLRLEACYHLYGNDLVRDRGPIEAGLGWCCAEATGFIGSDAVAKVRDSGPRERLVPYKIQGPGIARQGDPVIDGGVVASGTFSPCLEIGVGMAYLPAERATPGSVFEVDVRGRRRTATVVTKPIYRAQEG